MATIHDVPEDVLDTVFHLLPLPPDPASTASLLRLLFVCKRWRDVLASLPSLWRDRELTLHQAAILAPCDINSRLRLRVDTRWAVTSGAPMLLEPSRLAAVARVVVSVKLLHTRAATSTGKGKSKSIDSISEALLTPTATHLTEVWLPANNRRDLLAAPPEFLAQLRVLRFGMRLTAEGVTTGFVLWLLEACPRLEVLVFGPGVRLSDRTEEDLAGSAAILQTRTARALVSLSTTLSELGVSAPASALTTPLGVPYKDGGFFTALRELVCLDASPPAGDLEVVDSFLSHRTITSLWQQLVRLCPSLEQLALSPGMVHPFNNDPLWATTPAPTRPFPPLPPTATLRALSLHTSALSPDASATRPALGDHVFPHVTCLTVTNYPWRTPAGRWQDHEHVIDAIASAERLPALEQVVFMQAIGYRPDSKTTEQDRNANSHLNTFMGGLAQTWKNRQPECPLELRYQVTFHYITPPDDETTRRYMRDGILRSLTGIFMPFRQLPQEEKSAFIDTLHQWLTEGPTPIPPAVASDVTGLSFGMEETDSTSPLVADPPGWERRHCAVDCQIHRGEPEENPFRDWPWRLTCHVSLEWSRASVAERGPPDVGVIELVFSPLHPRG